jgi:uncharacterized protein involved in outer membrane biogenesis
LEVPDEAIIKTLLSSVESRLPVPVSAGEGDFGLAQWFLLRPAITVERLSIGNPEGFSPQSLLQAREVSAQIALLSLFQDRLEILRFTLHEPVLTIERDRKGSTNLAALFVRMSKDEATSREAGSKGGDLSIDSLAVESGTVRYQGPGKAGDEEGLTIRDIDLALADFAADKTCHMTVEARLFEGRSSRLDFEGRAGPFGKESLPARGDLSFELAPAEIPPSLRAEYFGDLLREPGDGSRMSLEAAMQGDLMATFQGQGKLTLSDLQLGRDEQNRIPLRGEVPLQVTVQRLLTTPSFEVRTQNASLELGRGRWTGSADVSFNGSRFKGNSNGSIAGVQINEMLGAFTSAEDAVFGRAEIPEYRIQFTGENAQQIRDSLKGQGRITLEDGRVTLFDLLGTIQQHVGKLLTGESPAEGATDFIRFASRLQIHNRQILVPELVLENSSSQVSGQGYVGFDKVMRFDLVTNVTGDLATKLSGKLGGAGRNQLRVPVKVRGTVNSPRVYPDVGRMATEQAVEKATGLLKSLFKKKEDPQTPQ